MLTKNKQKIILIDNYDSFTYNLYDYLLRLGLDCEVYKNDSFQKPEQLPPCDALVLSPGPGRPKDAALLMEIIEYYGEKLPILGVCLGHQAIAEYFGSTLCHASKPVHGKTSAIRHSQGDIFEDIPQDCHMMRYHSLIIKDLANELTPLAHSLEGELMAFRHKTLKLWGVQFHPESILSPWGLKLLENWTKRLG